MDNSQFWQAIQNIQNHINIINKEIGVCQNDIAWLKQSWWELINWLKYITGGIIVGIFLSLWNLIISKRNGRKT